MQQWHRREEGDQTVSPTISSAILTWQQVAEPATEVLDWKVDNDKASRKDGMSSKNIRHYGLASKFEQSLFEYIGFEVQESTG